MMRESEPIRVLLVDDNRRGLGSEQPSGEWP
jgi:hypothetical protein